MRVYFVRHGESVGNTLENKPGTIHKKDYDKLSELGWNQSRKLGKRLKREHLTHIVVSKLNRAQETAEAINETLHLPTDTLPYIHEHKAARSYFCLIRLKQQILVSRFLTT
ncbi:hypothetical protein EXS54_01780 [Patescibacteria group bacterium]|nr:hypothetical protein [Patescibacteria group bacterium]